MPELPEVETIRRELAPRLAGQTITRARLLRSDIVGFPAARRFARQVAGRIIARLSRKGKYLVFELDNGWWLVFHLRLSGHLEVVAREHHPRFERARLDLASGRSLSFVEPRVLGRVWLVDPGRMPRVLAGMEKMGPEPVGPGFSVDYLAARLRGRKASVKSLLLDQRVCCGVGNIYSDEALFRARVRPLRPAGTLGRPEVARLSRALRVVLEDGIKWCGTTMADERYVLPDGARGGFQQRLRVFGREGQRCRRPGCRGVIERVSIGNRGTRFCPVCQK